MSLNLYADRPRLCAFTFEDGRRCRTPRRPDHPYFCYFHARRDDQRRASEDAAHRITYHLSGDYLAFRDVNAAMAHAISAVASGHLKGKTASTIAFLCQSLVQSIARAESEHIRTFGESDWRDEVVKCYNTRRPSLYEPPEHDPEQHRAPAAKARLEEDVTPEEDAVSEEEALSEYEAGCEEEALSEDEAGCEEEAVSEEDNAPDEDAAPEEPTESLMPVNDHAPDQRQALP